MSALSHFSNIIPNVHATLPPAESWYPSGPEMDTQIIKIYQDQISEQMDLARSVVDFTDTRLDSGTSSAICTPTSAFYCTSQIQEHGFTEIEFMLGNNFWGISMNFGNDPNGLQLRQGIAHLIDKNSFSTNEPSGPRAPIDNPLPAGEQFGGTPVTYPNPCFWDQNNTQTGTGCATSTTGVGGTAYHLAPATGSNCGVESAQTACTYPWQPGFGSLDFCAAADHFITAFRHGLGITATKDANCVLLAPGQTTPGVGWPAAVTGNPPQFFVRVDDPPRFDVGNSMTQEICALFTGAFTTGTGACTTFLSYKAGNLTNTIPIFPGYFTSTSAVSKDWWIYTAAFNNVFPFDQSLFFRYNSRFVSGVSSIRQANGGPCANGSVPSPSASNYMYLCSSSYDSASTAVEYATTLANAFSATTGAMDVFGKNAFTIPIYTPSDTFGYPSNWSRVINADGAGVPNKFTWLNAWTATPPTGCPSTTPLCMRQGFEQTTLSLNPYVGTTTQDAYVLGNIYDSLNIVNPANSGQIMDWMTISTQELSNAELTYVPPGCATATMCGPGGTVDTFRFTLRRDMPWQDGNGSSVTPWDVKFSYATLLANGAFQSAGISNMVCLTASCADGVNIVSSNQIDVHVSSHGPLSRYSIGSLPILPGRYWSASCPGSIWDSDVRSAAANIVIFDDFPTSCFATDPAKLVPSYDPLAKGSLIGSGPWKCQNLFTGAMGGGCSSSGDAHPPPGGGYYSLTRFGIGHAPGSSRLDSYFRSNGNLALYVWTGNTGNPINDDLNFSRFAVCVNLPVGTPGCTHWQKGIGNQTNGPVGPIQVGIEERYVFLTWVSPFDANTSPPQGMVTFPPATLHEGSFTLNNCVVDPTNGYDC